MVCLSPICTWGFNQCAGNADENEMKYCAATMNYCAIYLFATNIVGISSWVDYLEHLLAIIGKQKSVYWECWLVEAQITWDQILCCYNDWDLSLCKKYSWYQPEKLNSVEYIMYNTCNIGQAEISVSGMLMICQSYNSGILANLCNKITLTPTRQSKVMIMVLGPIMVFIK